MRGIGAILVLACAAYAAEVIDRVAVVIDRSVITLGQIILENRLAAFQDGRPVDDSPQARRQTAERMVDRYLLLREVEISGYPRAQRVDAMRALEDLKKRYGSQQNYEAALKQYGLREEDVVDFLQAQLTVLRFLEVRFRPESEAMDTDVERYYREQFVPKVKKESKGEAPPLDAVRQRIRSILSAEEADRATAGWLKNAREQAQIEFRQGAFQ